MRYALAMVAALLSSAPALRADDAADARAVIDKAIKAHGLKPGDEKLAVQWKERGTVPQADKSELRVAATWTFRPPDRFRYHLVLTSDKQEHELVYVVNGEKVQTLTGANDYELEDDQKANGLAMIHREWITTLTPLAGTDFTLGTAKGKDVAGKPAVGVRVSSGKRTIATLYFDKASGLLVKREALVRELLAPPNAKEVLEEAFYSGYKEVDGRQVYTKRRWLTGGGDEYEATLSDHTFLKRVDAKLFEKPVYKP